MNSSNMAM